MICLYCGHPSAVLIFFIFHCVNSAENWTSMVSPMAEESSVNSQREERENVGGAVVLPPVVINPYFDGFSENLKREYRLEDFLWAGSGDGPMPSDQDGGLAWEDNGAVIGGGGEDGRDLIIRVTKTMVLFKTVLTTIVPVEITPTVVISSLAPTPRLITVPSLIPPQSPDLSSSIHPSSKYFDLISPTPTAPFHPPSSSTFPLPVPTPDDGEVGDNDLGLDDERKRAATTNRLYWVQTIIKANSSIITSIPQFQGVMQKNLARIYASAFKRHLMNSLGILEPSTNKQGQIQDKGQTQSHGQGQGQEAGQSSNVNNNNNDNDKNKINQSDNDEIRDLNSDIEDDTNDILKRRKKRRRRKRSEFAREEIDTDWIYLGQHLSPSKVRSLATTAINVTVSILNITEVDKLPHVLLNYIVCAEGNPIPATSAVQDLELVTKQEMQDEIGYEVINKAEALVASPLQVDKVEMATSPWLIVAIISIVIMMCLVVVIMYMVWKWKNNRLGDNRIISPARTTRPQSGIEGGVVNPAFSQTGPPSPIERSGVPGLPHSQLHQHHQQSQIQIHSASSTAGHHLIKSSALATSFTSTKSHHKNVDETTNSSRHLIISSQKPGTTTNIKNQQQALASELNILLHQQQQQQQHRHTKPEKLSPSSVKSQSQSVQSLSISSKSSADHDEIDTRHKKHRHRDRDRDKDKEKGDKSGSSNDENTEKKSRRSKEEQQITAKSKTKTSSKSPKGRPVVGLSVHKTRSRTPSPRKRLNMKKRLDSAASSSSASSLSLSKESGRRKTQKVSSALDGQREEIAEEEEEDEILAIAQPQEQEEGEVEDEEGRGSRSIGEYKSKSRSKSRSKSKSKSKSLSLDEFSGSGRFPGRLKVPTIDEHLDKKGTTSSRSVDKISYGNLDVCQEAIARPISAKAKKLLPSKSLQGAIMSSGSGGGGAGVGDATSISSSILMDHHQHEQGEGRILIPEQEHLSWRANMRHANAKDKDKDKEKEKRKSFEESSEDGENGGRKSTHEQDRDLSESYEPIDSAEVEPPTHKDAQVQTPTRRVSKIPTKYRKAPPKQSSESLISTESEEVIEVHHIDSSSGDGNPMGKMRKRFHQFLDDAFNIMGKKDGDDELGRSKSAKVSISHQIETRERRSRPWTSQQEKDKDKHGESQIPRLRPKSASFGPPKRAWGAGSERRCHSAKSNASSTGSFKGRLWSGSGGGGGANSTTTIFERAEPEDSSEQEQDGCDLSSTVVSEPIPIHVVHHPDVIRRRLGGGPGGSFGPPSTSTTEPIFPNYPIYPDIPIASTSSRMIPSSSSTLIQQQQQQEHKKPSDPAVPLILAIKEEIKRFEKVKVAEKQPPNFPSNSGI